MTGHDDVFLSYSRKDQDAAALLHTQLERAGLSVFKDDKKIRWSDPWLSRLQEAVATCKSFVVLVGRDGVGRWIGAETQVALKRYFGPQDDAERLPIFPILLGETEPDTLPVFLQLFQARTWKGDQSLPEGLIEQIRDRVIVTNDSIRVDGCPFVGLKSFGPESAHLFFGRQKETLDALTCFNTRKEPIVRWLEISGSSGCGKSSLMNAGLLPLVEKGWLWRRTGYEHWTCIGPMMPGKDPIEMLADCLAGAFAAKMGELVSELKSSDDALRYWLRERRGKAMDAAFMLAVDQFEELFNFAKEEERLRFDRLLAAALEDPECPLFVISTVRADFLDRFDALPRLVDARNLCGKQWTLAPIGPDGLREVIEQPARLAHLDVSEVKGLILEQARNELGALPLVENALEWLWNNKKDNRLSERLFNEAGGLAGILRHWADDLLDNLGEEGRARALELLFRLVKVDPDGFRHTRQRMPIVDAEKLAGSRGLLERLTGQRVAGRKEGPVRLITITDNGRWVNLIHETLIRSKGPDLEGKTEPLWPTLWDYIKDNRERAARREQAIVLRTQIVEAAAAGRVWSEERIIETVREIARSGISLEEVASKVGAGAFLGPTNPEELVNLTALAEDQDAVAGGRYGAFWRLPLGHKARARAGERLDVLGDPRGGVSVASDGAPEIDWRSISGGEVIYPFEPYQKQINSFRIARYPITVAQYRTFLIAKDGWCNSEWWGNELYRDPDGDRYDIGRYSNYPSVNISWFDAMAFCSWLCARLSLAIRLPNEWEWQWAAKSGNSGNDFPWGTDWDPEHEPYYANTSESGLGRLTAVGMYPKGVSQSGVLDLAGTIWEWCLNKFDKPNQTESSANDFDPRVRRGGSWADDRDGARCAYRGGYYPGGRSINLGFRVVSSPAALDC